MEEQVQEQQPDQKIEEKHNNLPFLHGQNKLAIIFIACLFFLIFGVGAFSMGRLSTQTPTPPPITPITGGISSVPTSGQVITIIPSVAITESMNSSSFCQTDTDCVLKNKPYCCGERKEYVADCYLEGEQPKDISCTRVGSCPMLTRVTSCACQQRKCVGY